MDGFALIAIYNGPMKVFISTNKLKLNEVCVIDQTSELKGSFTTLYNQKSQMFYLSNSYSLFKAKLLMSAMLLTQIS